MPIVGGEITGGGNTFIEVANYSALPSPIGLAGQTYVVLNSQGSRFLFNYYSKGLYYSDGTSWIFTDTPVIATQAEVNAGTVTDKYVTPNTLNSATQITNKVTKVTSTDNAITRYNSTGGDVQDSLVIVNDEGSITLQGVTTPAYGQGKLVYDTTNESLTFFNNDSNIALQVGQENWIRVTNNSGSSIPNGSPVYITGTSGGMPTIGLAKADSATTVICAGLVTETIANGAIGYITNIGLVRNFDTSAFSAGATVFVSAATAGILTSTAPLSPNYRFRVGIVIVSNATTGSVLVTPSTGSLGNGTGDQVFGMNTAGTAQEVKTVPVSVYTSGINSSATSGTTNTILTSVLVPSNTFSNGKNFRNDFRTIKTGTAGIVDLRMYVNTSASLSGATLLATYNGAAAHQIIRLVTNFTFKSATTIQRFSATVSVVSDEGVGGLSLAPVTFTYDSTQALYLIYAAQNANAGDSTVISYLDIRKT